MKIYCVGGAVRDKLLGLAPKEFDWVVVGSSVKEMLAKGYMQVGRDFPVFLHPKTKEEYALARTEKKISSGHTGFTCYAAPDVSLEEDLLRRDLTINAMAETQDGQIIDPYNGQKDISNKILRHVSNAFVEDPLRILRVARFSAKLDGFTVADETQLLMKQMVEKDALSELSTERVWKEFSRALVCSQPWQFFEVLESIGANSKLWPYLTINISRLTMIASKAHDISMRMGALFWHVDLKHAEEFSSRWVIPNKLKREICLISKFSMMMEENITLPKQLLKILDSFDVLRRPEALITFINLLAMQDYSVNSRLLKEGFNLIRKLDMGEIAKQHKDPAQGIHNAKLKTLTTLF